MKIAKVIIKDGSRPDPYYIVVEGCSLGSFVSPTCAQIAADELNAALLPLFLRFGSLVREEAEGLADGIYYCKEENCEGHDLKKRLAEHLNIPALLEKLDASKEGK